jgi:hypothetical protein
MMANDGRAERVKNKDNRQRAGEETEDNQDRRRNLHQNRDNSR